MGGNAFHDVSPVAKEDVQPIIAEVQRLIGPFEYRLLGSTGKRAFSGDIDLAVTHTDYAELEKRLVSALGVDNVNTRGRQFNQIYTRFVIDGAAVQVDFMIGDPRLLEFTHWSPNPGTSEYTGTHRTEYLVAIAKALSDTAVRDGRTVARVGYTLHHGRGLQFGARWCKPRKDQRGFVTKMTYVAPAEVGEFRRLSPELQFSNEELFTDPDIICEKLFMSSVNAIQVNSYEQIVELVDSTNILLGLKDLIWRLYTDRLDEIKLAHPRRT